MLDGTTTHIWQRIGSAVVGIAFLLLGVLGLIFPIMPGWIFIFAGVVALGAAIPPLRRSVSRVVTSEPARRVIDAAAASRLGRRLIAGGLRLQLLRHGLAPTARWQVVRMLLSRAIEQRPGESDG